MSVNLSIGQRFTAREDHSCGIKKGRTYIVVDRYFDQLRNCFAVKVRDVGEHHEYEACEVELIPAIRFP